MCSSCYELKRRESSDRGNFDKKMYAKWGVEFLRTDSPRPVALDRN